MIFASDLDQTLIFSERFLIHQIMPVRLIEELDGRPISYMTERAILMLKELHEKLLFVPVTTRTIEQYERITLFRNEVRPLYAITSNGGNVIRDDKIDEAWNRSIRSKIAHDCLPLSEVLARFEELRSGSWIQKEKTAEDLFHYFIIDREHIPADEMASFSRWMERNNWNVSIQGRKLYFVPAVVNKRDAVMYVKELEARDSVYASGDSLLDMCLVTAADHCLVPAHGEIHHLHQTAQSQGHFPFTSRSGILASEDILDWVLQACL